MSKRQIAVFSSTRAEYGLLKYLIKEIENDHDFILSLIISGSHLSSAHGNTIDEILSDGNSINHIINMLSSDDSKVSTTESLGKLIQKIAPIFAKDYPDLLILLDIAEIVGLLFIASTKLFISIGLSSPSPSINMR